MLDCTEDSKDSNHGTFLLILMLEVPCMVKTAVLHRDDDCSNSANKKKQHSIKNGISQHSERAVKFF